MSGISIFGVSEKVILLDLRLQIIEQLKLKFKTVTINEDNEIEIYVEEKCKIYGKTYFIRDDFTITINDIDFLLNYPDFENDFFLNRNNINYRNCNFSISTMVSDLGTIYILLKILSLFLTLVNGVIILNSLPSNYLGKFKNKIKIINCSNNKVIFILSKENLQDLVNQEEDIIIS